MTRIITFLFALFFSGMLQAQTITGTLIDNGDNSPVRSATVALLKTDSSRTNIETLSGANGSFTLRNVSPGNYLLSVSSVGYSKLYRKINFTGQTLSLGNITFTKSSETLDEIVVNSTPPPIRQKNDTVEFSADQYKMNPDATGEDLIKKMAGITVDRSGNVTANGESVRKITVDGRDYFGDDATATLRNLPSEVIDKIQVFDRLSDQAQMSGFDDGNTSKSINIVTKKDMRQGNFGRLYAGYGTDDRYSAGGNVSFFNNNRRISFVGLANNINQQNFSSQDLLGVTSSGNRGGGGFRGGGGGGFGGGGNNFTVGQQSGIAKTNGLGVNYSDLWAKKIDVSASYFLNNSNIQNDQITNRQNFLKDGSINYYDETVLSKTENWNNRGNLRMNYKIDSSNSILFTSNISFQQNNSVNRTNGFLYPDMNNPISKTLNNLISNNNGYNINNGLIYNHSFAKRGRSLSLGLFTTFNNRVGKNYQDQHNEYYLNDSIADVNRFTDSKTSSEQYRINLSYTEPLSQKSQLQFNYSPSFQKSRSDQETFDFDASASKYSEFNPGLSNVFDNFYNTQNGGVTFRTGDRNNMYSAGVSYQNSELKSNRIFPQATNINHSFNNLLGNAMARIRFSAKSNIRLMFRTSVNAPSVNQLQNIINVSNPFSFTSGNPDLKQQYNSSYIVRYTYTNTAKSQSFFANVFYNTINNYISNDTYTATQDSTLAPGIILSKGAQITKPVNVDGYMNVRSFFTYAMPIKFIKSNLNLNGGISYAKQPGMLSGVKNYSNNWNYNVGANLSSNISEYVDFDLSYSANFNDVTNEVNKARNSNYVTQSAGINFNVLTKKGTFFQNDLSNQSNSGLAQGFNQSYWLWNVAVGQKLFKNQMGELKLSVFDLLKQNKSIYRDVTNPNSYIADVKNEVLQQYFLLTFTYKLKTFGKPSATNRDPQRFRDGGFFQGAPPPGH